VLPRTDELWGWRVPLLLGCVIVPFLFQAQASLQERMSSCPQAQAKHVGILRSAHCQLGSRGHRTLMVTMTTVSFYMITAYTPTFGNSVLHLASIDSLIVTLCVGASNLFWLR